MKNKMRWRRLCLLHVLIFFVTMAILVPRVVSVGTKVYVYPPMITAMVGETFTVSVKISDAIGVYCWQFRLDWSASVLDFVSVTEGDFLKRQPQTQFVKAVDEDEADTDYVVAGCTTVGRYSGVSGSGTLATVTFQVEDVGETSLHFHNPYPATPADTFLMNEFLGYITFTAVDGTFTNIALPLPSFTFSPSIPEIGETITFDASASYDPDGYITSYFWEFGDGTTANVTNSVTYHVYNEAGDYIVALSVTDNASLVGITSKTLRFRYPHDVAVIQVSPNPTEVVAGGTVTITVIVLNDGTETETFTVTVYYDSSEVGTQTVANLPATQNRTLTFNWNTAGVSAGTYRIKVQASVVPGETETGDNLRVDGTVKVTQILSTSISISLSSSTSYVGFKVEIRGNLTCNGGGLSNTPILISYSVTGGQSWGDITLAHTAFDGGYSAVWMPSATGSYLVRATWAGNSTHLRTSTTVNLAVTIFEEQNVFSVTSNSTVSAFAFNSTSRELSFTVTGPTGTTGYANVYIAKTLVENIADIRIYFNGDQLNYTVTSLDDSWHLYFIYLHSTHKVTITLGHISAPFIETPLGKIVIYGIPMTVMVVLILFILKKKYR